MNERSFVGSYGKFSWDCYSYIIRTLFVYYSYIILILFFVYYSYIIRTLFVGLYEKFSGVTPSRLTKSEIEGELARCGTCSELPCLPGSLKRGLLHLFRVSFCCGRAVMLLLCRLES